MSVRVFMQALLWLFLGQSALHAQQTAPLTHLDLAALIDAGVAVPEIIEEAERLGLRTKLRADVEKALLARGLTQDDIERLASIAARVPTRTEDVFFDGMTGATWSMPAGWVVTESGDELIFAPEATAVNATAEIRVRVLPIHAASLRARGLTTLNDYHALRVREIREGEGKSWTYHGTWPLPALGWTGVHSVFEDTTTTQRRTTCLTWFCRGDRLLSISSRIEDPITHVGHDALVDDVTAILTGHVPRAVTPGAWACLAHEATKERLVVVDDDGSVLSWDRKSDRRQPLLAAGHDRVAAPAADFLVTVRKGLVESHRLVRGTWASPTPIQRVAGPVLSIDVGPLGDHWSIQTRTPEGARRCLHRDMRAQAVERAEAEGPTVTRTDDGLFLDGIALRMEGVIEVDASIDSRGVVYGITRLVGERTEFVLLAQDALHVTELGRLTLEPEDGAAHAVRRGTGEELFVVTPGAGLCSLPREGGFPVQQIATGKIRDFAIVP